jgi:hypothetical protein
MLVSMTSFNHPPFRNSSELGIRRSSLQLSPSLALWLVHCLLGWVSLESGAEWMDPDPWLDLDLMDAPPSLRYALHSYNASASALRIVGGDNDKRCRKGRLWCSGPICHSLFAYCL